MPSHVSLKPWWLLFSGSFWACTEDCLFTTSPSHKMKVRWANEVRFALFGSGTERCVPPCRLLFPRSTTRVMSGRTRLFCRFDVSNRQRAGLHPTENPASNTASSSLRYSTQLVVLLRRDILKTAYAVLYGVAFVVSRLSVCWVKTTHTERRFHFRFVAQPKQGLESCCFSGAKNTEDWSDLYSLLASNRIEVYFGAEYSTTILSPSQEGLTPGAL